jgi:hypothetical protein
MNASNIDVEGDPRGRDRRAAIRKPMRQTNAVLNVSGVDRGCQVRDLSPIGLGLASPDLPLPGQRVWVETRGLARSAAVVVWRDPARCGLRLEANENDAPRAGSTDGRAPRGVRTQRFFVRARADLASGAESLQRDVIDISANGLKLDGASGLTLGSRWLITLEGLREALLGHIRWTAGGFAGLRLDRPIAPDDLFQLLCRHG